MTMKPALVIALGIAASATLASAYAETYQWKDSSGRTVISDTPQPGAKTARVIGGPSPSVSTEKAPEKASEGPKTTAEKDMEFKKRQQEAKEKAEKDAQEQKAAADKRENCERAKRNLATLEARAPIASMNEKGERVVLDDAQRQQEMERARQFMGESCK